jgi:peptidoglycan glycosyltransferase
MLLNRITMAIANEGKVYDYTMIDKVLNKDNSVKKQYLPESTEEIMTPEEAQYLKKLMAGVTKYGTASNLSDLGIKTYGKTGTAENASGIDHSWFTGFAEPRKGSPIAITVLVEQSGGQLYASSVAADILWKLLVEK